jgi:aryl-alcohol dehydrogenase-like predicted oxidoreductase
MDYRAFGNTDLLVSAVGFGAWAIGNNQFGNSYGPTNDAESLEALETAYHLGCTLFDTADVYGHGHSETLLGQALKGWDRSRVVIATKGGGDFYSTPPRLNFSEKHIRFAVEQSLKRLGTDYIDLYQLHNPSMALIQNGSVFNVLKALKAEGKIRHYGLSIFDPQEGLQAINHGQVDGLQAVYNLLDRRPANGLLAQCHDSQVGFIAREPLANGFLTGKFKPYAKPSTATDPPNFVAGDIRANWPMGLISARAEATEHFRQYLPEGSTLAQLALRFAMDTPHVSSVIVGCKTSQQVRQNFAAASQAPLPLSTMAALNNDKAFA